VPATCRYCLLALLLVMQAVSARAVEPARVFAASSLTGALTEVAAQWQARGHPAPVLVFGGSSTLAKQIEAGAPADLFAAADLRWMDYLDVRERIDRTSRANLLGNALLIVAPANAVFPVRMQPSFDIAHAFTGRLCTGEPGVVPVGTYAREALQALGWWDVLAGRIVGTDDVRAALVFVERGECAAGIVYATDASASTKVTVVGRFPSSTHTPIVYPFALIPGAREEARLFLAYLSDAPAQATFRRYGFTAPARRP
jgi:molybdate transport system substrate-binding protein